MNDFVRAILLGIVEGLTEFLPVSSTAHLRLSQAVLGIDLESGYWKMFTVVIQLPAILAVVIYFRARIAEFVRSFFADLSHPMKLLRHPLVLVLIATVVTAVPALLLKKLIKSNLESLLLMGVSLLAGGVVMWVVDAWAARRERRLAETEPVSTPPTDPNQASALQNPPPKPVSMTRSMDEMKPWQAAWIGAVQILSAVFPGVSRSMSTIAAAQIAGLTRTAALEFSFFVSIPIMIAACLFDLKDSLGAPPGDPAHIAEPMTAERWMVIGVGGVTSFVVAWGVIAWFMAWVRRRGFTPFAIYRIVIGVAVIVWAVQSAA